jgi:hypothetical protein
MRRYGALLRACGMALLTLGCGSAGTETISLSNADAGGTVVAGSGDKIELTLQTIGAGSFGNPTVSSGSVVLLGQSSVRPPIPAGVTQLYRFEAVAPGRADITIPHTGDLPVFPVNPTFAFSVEVR